METSLTAGLVVIALGVLWRVELNGSGPSWLRASVMAVIVIGVASVTVTLTIYAVVDPIRPRTAATLLIAVGMIGLLAPLD